MKATEELEESGKREETVKARHHFATLFMVSSHCLALVLGAWERGGKKE